MMYFSLQTFKQKSQAQTAPWATWALTR